VFPETFLSKSYQVEHEIISGILKQNRSPCNGSIVVCLLTRSFGQNHHLER